MTGWRRKTAVFLATVLAAAGVLVAAPASVRAASDGDLEMNYLHVVPSAVEPGGSATLHAIVMNLGATDVDPLSVEFSLPAGLTYAGGSECSAAGANVTCLHSGPILAGSSTAVSAQVALDGTATSPLAVTVTALSSGDPDSANNSTTGMIGVTTDPAHSADVYGYATFRTMSAPRGSLVDVDVTVGNHGPDAATDVAYLLTPTSDLVLDTAPASCTPTCSIGTLQPNEQVTFTYRFEVATDADQALLYNTVVAAQHDPDPSSGNSAGLYLLPVGEPGRIAGTVSQGGQPVANAPVTVHRTADMMYAGSATTDAQGRYLVQGLPVGSYRVGVSQGMQQRWYPSAPELSVAGTVTIDAMQPHATGVDIAFAPGRISGTVRVGATPLEGANVMVMNSTYMYVGSAVTDAQGQYSVTGLDDGAYRVRVTSNGMSERWYPAAPDSGSAATLMIDAMTPVRAGIDVTFPGGTIAGTVMWRGAPLPFANVIANNNSYMYGASTTADQNGEFVLRGLSDTTWTLAVAGGSEYYAQHPTPVVVGPASPNPSGLVLVVPPGRVTGTALKANGDPIMGGSATLRSSTGQQYNGTVGMGTFAIGGVPLGTYTLSVTDMVGMGNALTVVHPTPIEITAGTLDVDGLVLQLPLPGSITGHVNGPTGAVPYATVTLYGTDGSYLAGGNTDANGSYTFGGVAPGDYYVSASYYMAGVGYTERYHPASPTRAGGTVLHVDGGDALTDIDIALPGPATVSGTVTGSDGGSVGAATVYVLRPGTNFPIASTTVGPTGHFEFAALPSDEELILSVQAPYGSPYLNEWYDDQPDFATATRIILSSGEARTIDMVLERGASVSGHVSNATGDPIDGWVTLFAADDTFVQGQVVNGDYNVLAVRPGTYVAYVVPGDPGTGSDYAPEYYGDSYTRASGTEITVAAGASVGGIDFTLDVGGRIEGRVVDALGQPVPGTQIDGGSMNAPPNFYVPNSQGYAQADGIFVLRGLAPGTYDLTVRPATITGLLPSSLSRTVAPGQTVTVGNIALVRGAVGTVTIRDDSGIVVNPPYYTGPIVCPDGATFTTSYSCMVNGVNLGVTTGISQPGGAGWFIGPLAPGDYWAAAFSLSMGTQTGTQVPLSLAAGESFHCDLTMPGTTASTASCQTMTQPATGTVRGRVTGPNGTGVEGINVTAEYDVGPNQSVALFTQVTTDAQGYYTMTGVQPGSYRIKFAPPPGSVGWVQQWWTTDGAQATAPGDADELAVAGDQTISGIDVRLVYNGSGTATITQNGVPVAWSSGKVAALCREPAHYLGSFFQCSDGSPALLAFFDSMTQRYVWQTISPGTYNVRAADVFGGPLLGAETSVTLFSGDTIDCTLPLEGTGTATCTVTHNINDNDGVNGTVEDAAPNDGDGNNDGTPDAVQVNVTSVADPTIDPGTTQADYITLAVEPDANGGTSYPLANVTVTDPPASDPAPPAATPQTGLVGFEVLDLPTSGTPATVVIDLYLGAQANSYWKYDQVNGWRDFTSIATFAPAPVQIGGIDRWKVTLTITDNGFGDEDSTLGVISDPGVFAFVDPDSTPPTVAWTGGIADGQSFYYGLTPAAPTCTAVDLESGPAECTVTGYSTVVGSHTLTATALDVAGNQTVETRTYTVLPYTLKGFQKPVDMGGVWNTMNAGKTVSFRFEVFRGTTELTSVSLVQSFRSTTVSCSSGTAIEDPVELVSNEEDGLEYESGPGEFRQKWKTPNRKGTCLKATLTTVDGSSITALFKLK